MAEIEQKLTKILKELMEKTDVFIAIVVDKNGLPIHSLDKKSGKPLKDEPEILAAGLSSSMLSLAEKSPDMINIDAGELNQMLIQSKKSMLIIRSAGDTAPAVSPEGRVAQVRAQRPHGAGSAVPIRDCVGVGE